MNGPLPEQWTGGGEEQNVDRMSALDASFFYAESENTPMHVGSVAVFDGPAPSYGDVVRLLAQQAAEGAALPPARAAGADAARAAPCGSTTRTSRSCTTCGTPRCPRPGSDEQLRNLAGRVLGQRLDMAKPLWELWLVEGLADDRWALISKVHHCMVDGVAGTDLMQLMFDLEPDATHEAPKDWTPRRPPSSLSLVSGAVSDAVTHPLAAGLVDAHASAARCKAAEGRRRVRARPSPRPCPRWRSRRSPRPPGRSTARSARTAGGPGPTGKFEEFKAVRTALGGTVNDVVLTAITGGFRDLLEGRGELSSEKLVVRSMVPVSVRKPGPEGQPEQPGVGRLRRPARRARRPGRAADGRSAGRWTSTRSAMQAVDANSIIAMGNYVAPTLLSLGVRAGAAGRPDVRPGGDHQRARPAGPALRARPADDHRAPPTCRSPAARAARSASSPT